MVGRAKESSLIEVVWGLVYPDLLRLALPFAVRLTKTAARSWRIPGERTSGRHRRAATEQQILSSLPPPNKVVCSHLPNSTTGARFSLRPPAPHFKVTTQHRGALVICNVDDRQPRSNHAKAIIKGSKLVEKRP